MYMYRIQISVYRNKSIICGILCATVVTFLLLLIYIITYICMMLTLLFISYNIYLQSTKHVNKIFSLQISISILLFTISYIQNYNRYICIICPLIMIFLHIYQQIKSAYGFKFTIQVQYIRGQNQSHFKQLFIFTLNLQQIIIST